MFIYHIHHSHTVSFKLRMHVLWGGGGETEDTNRMNLLAYGVKIQGLQEFQRVNVHVSTEGRSLALKGYR